MSGILGADGGFAEYMLASDDALVHLPDNLSFEQAAPLMCAGVGVSLQFIRPAILTTIVLGNGVECDQRNGR